MAARFRRLPVPVFAAACAAVFAIAMPAPAAPAASCPGADAMPIAASPATAKSATLCLLNNERAANGLPPLASQPQLETAATGYSQAMVQQHFFAHTSPSGDTLQDRLRAYISGVTTWDIGENLAWGEGSYATPASVVGGWMRSEGHRANILNGTFREIGIGIVAGTPGGSPPESSATYTAEFGARVGAPSGSGAPAGPGSQPGGAGGAADPTAASASTGNEPASDPSARKPARKVSAAKRRWIKAQCARIARKTKLSRKARQARISRCVKARMKAAQRR
jgi:uncharacterized protein YkwD